MKGVLIFFGLLFVIAKGYSQPLSNLHATRSDALFTTYAAPPARSVYKTDQGYQFQWFDDDAGVEFISANGPNFGLAFQQKNRLVFALNELYKEPVITTSYSDLVRYFYYPVKHLRVEVSFAVYSSETSFAEYRLVNEGSFPVTFTALPYFYFPSGDSLMTIKHQIAPESLTFPVVKQLDGWMKEHNIPLENSLTGCWSMTGCTATAGYGFIRNTRVKEVVDEEESYGKLISSLTGLQRNSGYIQGMVRSREFSLQPGDATVFSIKMEVKRRKGPAAAGKKALSEEFIFPVFDSLVRDDETAYSKIPEIPFHDRDHELLYRSAFSLMRQCMMPPEGECHYNYYVFSREPKWGWGYGGEVFHESLTMLAYTLMDPAGAMNAQRVYMERQDKEGYINYRTGPWLNETIETNGKKTTSAPWFNYENLEIYKITKDRKFLTDAYQSGKKFYQYYVANRDSNNNGLCEWGAHAELESVRDARVAVWDKVGWPANLEGPDLNAMLVMEAKSLAEMAKLLGLPAESNSWQKDAAKRSELINRYMWDRESSFYYNVNKKDQTFTFKTRDDLKIKEIIGFLPLWAGIADSSVAKSLVRILTDTSEFWRPFGVPSLTARDPYYCPIGYWNGPVWVQWNYLVANGLRRYGYDSIAGQITEKVIDNMIMHLKSDHVFWEFYSADDRQAGWNRTYVWAGIVGRMMKEMVK